MNIVENKVLDLVLKIIITVGIIGIVMLYLQEIIVLWDYSSTSGATAYSIILIIADFIGCISLVIFAVWMFLTSAKDIVLNIALIFLAFFVLLYAFGHFFIINHAGSITGTALTDYSTYGVSLIGLIILVILSILMIIFQIVRAVKRESMSVYEKFAVLLWLITIAIYDISGFYFVKQSMTYGTPGTPMDPLLGITFLPNTLELILMLFIAFVAIYKLFGKMDKTVEKVIMLTLFCAYLLSMSIGTINVIGYAFGGAAIMVPSMIAFVFLMTSCLAMLIFSFVTLVLEFPKSSSSRGR